MSQEKPPKQPPLTEETVFVSTDDVHTPEQLAALARKDAAAAGVVPPKRAPDNSDVDTVGTVFLMTIIAIVIGRLDTGMSRITPVIMGTVAIAIWRLSGRRMGSLLAIFLAVNIVAMYAFILTPMIQANRDRQNTRACYANQKTIAGAVEMYNLDKMTRRSDVSEAFSETLVSGGYLQAVPQDPGDPEPHSANNYQFTTGGNGIKCGRHGTIQGNS